MEDDDALQQLISSYETRAVIKDVTADRIVEMAERDGWHDNFTQLIDQLRQQAETSRMLAQEVRDLSAP